MTDLARITVQTSGYVGAPGYNILHASPGTFGPGWDGTAAQELYDNLYAVYSAVAVHYNDGVTIDIAGEVTVIDSASGNVTNVVTVPTPTGTIVGTGSANGLSRGVCVCNAFLTDMFVDGRRLIGRAFMGPSDTNVFDSDGSIYTPVIDDFIDAWAGLISGVGTRLAVYHRPPHGTSTGGYYGDVVNVIPRKRPSYLRSRVD
jgi:hypothetical protein